MSIYLISNNDHYCCCFVISLHYTTVSLGTPGLKFMVALDTGSDLFWVPCDCSRCASIENTAYSVCCFTSRCVDFYLDCHFFM